MNEQQRQLLQQIGRTSRVLYAAFERAVGHPLPRWRLLAALEKNGRSSQKELSTYLMMDAGAVTRLLKQLEQEKLVARSTDPADNRLTRVELTAAGAALLAAAQKQRQSFARTALKGLPAADIATTAATLQHLETRMREMLGD